MKDRDLYSVDLPVTVRSKAGLYPMVLRVPGWVNFGILRARAVPLPQSKRGA